jgi:hypothetical protein
MKAARYTGITLLSLLAAYAGIMLSASKLHFRGKPMIYVTNDYYHWKGGDTYRKFSEFSKNGKYDVVVLGSSRAYRGYSPALFDSAGYSMFNLGSSAQSIHNTFYVARNFVNSATTKLLIVDVFSGAFRDNQLESSSDLIENISNKSAAMDIALHTPDMRSVNLMLLRELTDKDAPYFTTDDYSGNGFSAKTDSLPQKLRKSLAHFRQPATPKIQVDERAVDCLDALFSWCEQNGVRVVAVYSPVSDFYPLADHAVFLSRINPVIARHHVPFYDYSKKIRLSTTDHFYDDTHMNLAGVQIFNRILLADLAHDKLLP